MTNLAIVLCGVPASGKTTLRRDYEEQIPDLAVISSDDYIEAQAKMEGKTYNDIFSSTIRQADAAFWKSLDCAIAVGKTILIDRTNLTPKSRKKLLDILLGSGYTAHAVWFETPEQEEWERRLNSREGKTIPSHILDQMKSSFVVPTQTEGFNLIAKGN
jgi:predicted kinase